MTLAYPHVEERDGSYYIQGSRIPIIPLIYHWNNGEAPESIQRKYPTLTLAEVHGAALFYLDHREMLDKHFAQIRREEEAIQAEFEARNAPFREEMQRRQIPW